MKKEALDYFMGEVGYDRLFALFKRKYQSLGRMGGSVKTDVFTDRELSSIARFFGTTIQEMKQKEKITLVQFQNQLDRTKFQGITLKELLEAYFNETLVSKKEAKQQREEEQLRLLKELKQKHMVLEFWFDYLLKKNPDSYWIWRWMEEEMEKFREAVHLLHTAFTRLPDHYERLPLFSQRITHNPHAFDRSNNLGKLFLHLLSVHKNRGEFAAVYSDSESINELFLHYRLLRDDITNFVTCANLLAETGREVHPVFEAAVRTETVLNVPLRELMSIVKAYPANGHKTVWIVENSGVYSSLVDQFPNAPLICTQGQFKLAALVLLDLLAEEDCVLYYAGDFDPEGITMANRLLQRYPSQVMLWRMDENSYADSEAAIDLPEERLKKLDSVTATELQQLIAKMKQKKKAGYQEALMDDMTEDLKKAFKKQDNPLSK